MELSSAVRPLLGGAVFVGALVVWELWARAAESFVVPTATDVAEVAWEVWPTTTFLSDVAASLRRLATGYAVGGGIGILLGLLMGSSLAARRVLDPLVELMRATPAIAVVPILLVVFDYGDSTLIAVIAFGVVFPVLVGTIEGVRAVSPEARDTASMLHVGRLERVFRIYFPAALPSIMAGLRVALSIGLVLVVVSEFTGGEDGVGTYILERQGEFNYPEMYAGILFLGLLGYVLNGLFLLLEARVLSSHYRAAGEPVR